MKICPHCKTEKHHSEFYKDSARKSGIYPICKSCCKERNNIRAEKIREYYQSYYKNPKKNTRLKKIQKAYRQRPEIKSKRNKASRDCQKRNIDRYAHKNKARSILNNAVATGKITRQPCFKCGEEKSHGHHPDYSKPLDVIWVCLEHHMELFH